jgi:hypothetical protein
MLLTWQRASKQNIQIRLESYNEQFGKRSHCQQYVRLIDRFQTIQIGLFDVILQILFFVWIFVELFMKPERFNATHFTTATRKYTFRIVCPYRHCALELQCEYRARTVRKHGQIVHVCVFQVNNGRVYLMGLS